MGLPTPASASRAPHLVGSLSRADSPWPVALRAVILAAFCVVAYLPSFAVPFAFDDVTNILLNPRVQPAGWHELGMALDARGPRDRPVAMLSFALNYLHGGLDPVGYHAVNLLIHVAATITLFFLLRNLALAPRSPAILRDRASAFAFAGALIWAVHPVNTQAVTYIVQRMAVLAALFYLIALLLFVLWRLGHLRTQWALPGILIAFLLALGSKLHAITLPAAILLLDIAFFTGPRRVHAVAAALVVAVAVPAAMVFAGDQFDFLYEPPPHRDFSGIERLMTEGRVIWHYLSLIAWPDAQRLQVDYDFAVSRSLFVPPSTFLAWVGLVAISAIALLRIRQNAWPAAGWIFFCLAIAIESSFILLELAFEHRLYLPATFLVAGILAPAFVHVPSGRWLRALSLLVLVIGAVLASQTIERNHAWANPGTLWAGDLERGASAERAALNSAVGHIRRAEPIAALEILRHVDDGIADARHYQARGEALFALRRFEDALAMFRKAFEHRPNWSRTAYFSGQSLVHLGRVDDAAQLLQQMEENASDSVFTAALRAEVMAARGRREAAAASITDYLEQHPRQPAVNRSFLYTYAGNLALADDRPAEAIRHYRSATELDAGNWGAWRSLYALFHKTGRSEQAEAVARYMHQQGIPVEGNAR